MNLSTFSLLLLALLGSAYTQNFLPQINENPNAINDLVEDAQNSSQTLASNGQQSLDNYYYNASAIYNDLANTAASTGTNISQAAANALTVTPNDNGTFTVSLLGNNTSLNFDNVPNNSINAIQQSFDDFSAYVNGSNLPNVTTDLQALLNNGSKNAADEFVASLATASALSNSAQNWTDETKNSWDNAWNNVSDYFNDLHNRTSNAADNIGDDISNAATNASNTLGGWFDDRAQDIRDTWNSGVDNVGNGVNTAVDETGNAFDNAGNAVNNGVNSAGNAFDNAGNAVNNGVNSAGNAINNGANSAGNAVNDAANAVGDAINNAANSAGNAVGDAANTVGNGISSAANSVGNAIGGIF